MRVILTSHGSQRCTRHLHPTLPRPFRTRSALEHLAAAHTISLGLFRAGRFCTRASTTCYRSYPPRPRPPDFGVVVAIRRTSLQALGTNILPLATRQWAALPRTRYLEPHSLHLRLRPPRMRRMQPSRVREEELARTWCPNRQASCTLSSHSCNQS
jgi:hypothetical protein